MQGVAGRHPSRADSSAFARRRRSSAPRRSSSKNWFRATATRSWLTAPCSRTTLRSPAWSSSGCDSIRLILAAPVRSCARSDVPEVEAMSASVPALDRLLRARRARVQATTGGTELTKLLDVNARTWGYHSLGQRAGVDFPYLLYADQIGRRFPAASRLGPGSPGSGSRPISRRPASSWRDAGSTGGPICGRCACSTSSPYSRPTTYVRVSPSLPCCPISQSREVSELFVDEVMTETEPT